MREHGPTVLLVALLAFFGIRAAVPDRPGAPGEPGGGKKGQPSQEKADEEATRADDHFWWPLDAFRRTGAEATAEARDDQPFEEVPVWRGFPVVPGWELRTLLACLPDPVDSTSGYQFDSVVDAIQRAAETQKYVLDRYYYPWSGQKGKAGKAPPLDLTVRNALFGLEGPRLLTLQGARGPAGRPFEREPGALLFRSPRPAGVAAAGAGRGTLLLVLLVGETATAGLHKEALTAGLRLIGRAQRDRPTVQVDLLGPFFSGGQVSLAEATHAWAEAEARPAGRPGRAVHCCVRSGSATGVDVQTFRGRCRPATVDFAATVVPDLEVVTAMFEYLGVAYRQGRQLRFREDVACLSESNTAFGQNLRASLQGSCPAGTAAPPRAYGLTFLPFPLHVSDVRTARGKDAGAGPMNTLSLPSFGKDLRLPLEEGKPPRDTEPSLVPSMAAVQSERVLTGLLTTIAHERFRYALIVATDVKDRLFLASLLRQHSPETRLLFAGGDLLLSHPDFRADLRGAVVGSPYPLYLMNQHWSFPARGNESHLLFAGQSEQGCYNATVALLNPTECSPHLLEYGVPFPDLQREKYLGRPGVDRGKPPVWISIIGQGGPQPLAAVPLDRGDSYVLPGPAGAGGQPTFEPTVTGLWLVSTLGVAVLTVALAWGYARGGLLTPAGQRGEGMAAWFVPRGRRQVVYTAACLLGPFFAFAYVAWVWTIPLRQLLWLGDDSPVRLGAVPWLVALLAALLTLFFLVFVLAWPLWQLACLALPFLAPAPWWLAGRFLDRLRGKFPGRALKDLRRHWLALVTLCLLALLVAYLGTHWPEQSGAGPAEDLFLFERATSLSGGVSPVFPALLLGFAFFWWGSRHLKRLQLLSQQQNKRIAEPFPEGAPFTEALDRARTVWAALRSPHRATGTWTPLVWLVLFFTFSRLANRFAPSVEGPLFDGLILFFLALFSVLLVDGLLHLVRTWRAVRGLLRALAEVGHLTAAFRRIPATVTAMFGPYLSVQRPGRESQQGYLNHQRQELLAGFWGARSSLATALGWAPDETETVADSLGTDSLSAAAATCLRLLTAAWKAPALRAKLEAQAEDGPATKDQPGAGRKPGDPVAEWLRLAEDFSAVQALAYLSQFFVQLRNQLAFLALGPLVLLFAVSSYPFHPQQLWLLFSGALVLLVTGVVLWIITAIERDPVVSSALHTDPGKINFHWTFLGDVAKYALPALGVLVATSPDVSDLVHSWLDPVLRVIR
jgi:hypothetical protein